MLAAKMHLFNFTLLHKQLKLYLVELTNKRLRKKLRSFD